MNNPFITCMERLYGVPHDPNYTPDRSSEEFHQFLARVQEVEESYRREEETQM